MRTTDDVGMRDLGNAAHDGIVQGIDMMMTMEGATATDMTGETHGGTIEGTTIAEMVTVNRRDALCREVRLAEITIETIEKEIVDGRGDIRESL